MECDCQLANYKLECLLFILLSKHIGCSQGVTMQEQSLMRCIYYIRTYMFKE